MSEVITFINMKGGVGKTTLAVNVAYTLSKIEGKKVLLIDEDPQGNATSGLGISKEREKSTYDIIIDEIDINEAIVDTGIKNLRNMPI